MSFEARYNAWVDKQRQLNPFFFVKCKTCGFFLNDQPHGWHSGDSDVKISGITCDFDAGVSPLGNRRKSIIEGFDEDLTPAPVAKKQSCECGVWMTGGNHSGWCPDARRQHG